MACPNCGKELSYDEINTEDSPMSYHYHCIYCGWDEMDGLEEIQ